MSLWRFLKWAGSFWVVLHALLYSGQLILPRVTFQWESAHRCLRDITVVTKSRSVILSVIAASSVYAELQRRNNNITKFWRTTKEPQFAEKKQVFPPKVKKKNFFAFSIQYTLTKWNVFRLRNELVSFASEYVCFLVLSNIDHWMVTFGLLVLRVLSPLHFPPHKLWRTRNISWTWGYKAILLLAIVRHGRYNVLFNLLCLYCKLLCFHNVCRTSIRVGKWDPDLCLAAGEQSFCCEWILSPDSDYHCSVCNTTAFTVTESGAC